jgi:hypothetical protein
MKIRFDEREIEHFAARYEYPQLEPDRQVLRSSVSLAGHLTLSQLQQLADWKSPRSAGHIKKNSDQFIQEVTGFALTAIDERSRIESLTLLDGVLWPTASVVLHFCHRDPYPIIDYRAIWSVSAEVPVPYTFRFWFDYVSYCREVAQRNHIQMRVLDRALWQFSKEHQIDR